MFSLPLLQLQKAARRAGRGFTLKMTLHVFTTHPRTILPLLQPFLGCPLAGQPRLIRMADSWLLWLFLDKLISSIRVTGSGTVGCL